MKFPESKLAHELLDGLKGIEIGGSAHNPFGLDTINVDLYEKSKFKDYEIELCGESLQVDVVAPGDCLPFPDKSYDFVISSHVIEHFWNPIKALREWKRVARKYIYIICPHRDRTFDRDQPLTTTAELIIRHLEPDTGHDEGHHSFWITKTFIEFIESQGYSLFTYQDIDDKVGNGFTVVIKLD
jgi:SAM-dependent methyltransferase